MKIKVHEDRTQTWLRSGSRDWYMFCHEHDAYVTCYDWKTAYEAAVGHACMAHPR